jgi:hypothetical protein
MLKITDLAINEEMENTEMAGVRGGFNAFAIFDSSTFTTKSSLFEPPIDPALLVLGRRSR